MSRKKATRPRAARKKLDFDELVAPELRELLPPEWRSAKPGQKALVLMRWADPVDPHSELVNAAIGIIRPAKEKEASCRGQVAQAIRSIRMMENEERAGALMLQKLRRASLKTAKLLAKLPVALQHRLLRSQDYPIIRIDATAKPEVTAPARCERLRIELNSLASEISPLLANMRTGPKFDWVKFNVALNAYDTLVQFAKVLPTKTAAGPFYELATLYYEAATGRREVSMERYCRRFMKVRATWR